MAQGSSEPSGKPARKAGDQTGSDLRGNISYLPDVHRMLPQSPDAERGVLCSIFLQRDALGECIEKGLDAQCFHIPAHATVYEVLRELWTDGTPFDLITVTQALRDRNLLEKVGGPAFVSELFTFIPTAANRLYYINIVLEKFTLREIIRVCTEYAARSYEEQQDISQLLDEVETQIFHIAKERYRDTTRELHQQVMDAIETIQEMYDNKGALTGLGTGFAELDRMTDGLQKSQMIVIAARPSMGKTALAMNIAEHVAIKLAKPVGIFSLEMSSQQLVQRLLCSLARVNMQKVRDGFLSSSDFSNLTTAATHLSQCKMFIDDTASLSIMELRAKARRFKAQHQIELIVIDYLQLLRSTSRRAQDNRQLEIAEISAGIKALAKELDIPILVLAQLNRQPEARAGGKPRLSDLRESGSIEQDADLVALLVREEYYAEDEEAKQEAEGKAELIIAKQRSGPVGDVPLTFLKEFTRFENRAREQAA
jgi:replicative DNA helicase